MMQKKYVLWLFLSLMLIGIDALPLKAQNTITLEDIWKNATFRSQSVVGVNWMKNGQYYTSQVDNKVVKYDITTGKEVEIIFGKPEHPALNFDNYELNATEDKIVFSAETEPLYRHSSKSFTYIFDIKTKELKKLNGDKHYNATLSPDGSKIAFVRNNNLYVVNLTDLSETALTQDGTPNAIINGMCDWVYEEEFGFTKAFEWSPDSKRIAYYRFDESKVKEYNMQMWAGIGNLYPVDYKFKYPKAGEDNATVQIKIYDLDKKTHQNIDIGAQTDIYIPRITWTKNPLILSIRRLNRLQNQMELLHAQAENGSTQVVMTEKSNTYIDLEFTDDLEYTADGKSFIFTSERTGFKHLYISDMAGKITPITSGNWEVAQLLGYDEKNKVLYFTSTEISHMERHLYSININGKDKTQLSKESGMHNINFTPDFSFYLDYYSSAKTPTVVNLYKTKPFQLVKTLEENAALREKLKNYTINYKEFFDFKATDGTTLYGWTIKPHNFDPNKKYPVLMFLYGGPGSQQVLNNWDNGNFYWYQVLASKGYMVVCVDNRGTGGRGEAFKKVTYAQLGKYETQDQIDAAKYVGSLPYVEKSRIGIWGWSYGGYMSSLCLFLGNDIFKMAMAVAPVTNWRFYDTIYTERFLQKPQDNVKGYDDFSPITHVDKLRGKYLLIHGTGDDNVHFQNSLELQNALIKANKQFESFYYPNRNHGIYGGNTRLHLYTLMTKFVESNL